MGFRGKSLGHLPGNGGFDLQVLAKIKKKYQSRNIILIKGRQGGYVGKAFNVLKALNQLRKELGNYQIKIIMSSPDVKAVARFLNLENEPKFEIMPRLPYKELLSLFAQSRLAISASDVDGSPIFLLEAMAMGVFPIHSDMESVREWIKDGQNGLLFPVDDIESLSKSIKKALADNQLVSRAKVINWRIARQRMDRNKIRPHIKNLIETKILKKHEQ